MTIDRLKLLALLACALAGGCAPTLQRVNVLGGTFALEGPRGYCTDRRAMRDEGRTGGFALFGDCAVISGNLDAPRAGLPALLSATVGPVPPGPLKATFPGFERLFNSPAGREVMAQSGIKTDVTVLRVKREGDVMFLKVRDGAHAPDDPIANEYWRAIRERGGRILTLSILPLAGTTISDKDQITMLRAFDAAIKRANPGLAD